MHAAGVDTVSAPLRSFVFVRNFQVQENRRLELLEQKRLVHIARKKEDGELCRFVFTHHGE